MDAAPSSHPTGQTLSAYGLGKLDDLSAAAIDAHLERCPDCRRRVAALSSDSFLDRIRDAQVPGKSTSGRSQLGGTQSYEGRKDPAPPAADTLPPGLAEHPDYEIKGELGRGGMGVVYLAHNKLMGRDEVLKVMGRQILDRPGVLERFLREIRAVAKLRHPNIVTAYSAVRIGESIVFAMEYVEGLDLSRMVKAKGPLPVPHACNFVYQAALGLQHAHEGGLVHRDIKPGNLMLSRTRDKATVKVLDFGLAKATREEKVDRGLTSEGQALGTPDYIAPEQIMDAQSADIRADIYSLGGTLYHLLTGHPPFQASSLYDVYQAHISRDAAPLNLVRPEVPAELAALVAKMMAKERGRRFQTPGEVAQALLPFFKKGNVEFRAPRADLSQTRESTASRPVSGAVSMPAQPATGAEQLIVRPAKAVEASRAESRRESVIEFPETERSMERGAGVAPGWRPPWVWPTLAAGVLLLGLVAAWATGAFKFRTDQGDLVFSGLPDQAVVTIDGKVSTVEWPGGQDPARVTVPVGEHRVKVELNGVEVYGEEVKIVTGQTSPIRLRLEHPVTPGQPSPAPGELSTKTRAILAKLERVIPMKYAHETPLEDVLRDIRSATRGGANDPGIPIYVDPVALNRAQKTMTSPVALDLEGVPLKTTLPLLLSQLGLAYCVHDGLLIVTVTEVIDKEFKNSPAIACDKSPATLAIVTKLEEAVPMPFFNETPLEAVLAHVKKATKGPNNDPGMPIYVDPVGLNQAEKTMTSPVTLDLEGVPLRFTLWLLLKQLGLTYCVHDGLLIVTVAEVSDKEFNKAPATACDKSPGTLAIVAKLEAAVRMPFFNETPLEAVLAHVKKATKGPNNDPGIPIYVDPIGLNQTESAMFSPVTLNLEDIPLRVTLRLLLKQRGLAFYVKDGLLIISAEDLVEAKLKDAAKE